jgi:CheY-like chemotaxis protein
MASGTHKADRVTAHQLPDDEAAAPVLVVDDDQAIRTLFVSVLRAAGVRAIAVATGDEALAVLDQRKIAAVLLDDSRVRYSCSLACRRMPAPRLPRVKNSR